MSDGYKPLFYCLESMPFQFEIGALKVDVMKISYVPPGPDWHVPAHKHSSYEFHFIISGKGYITMEDKPFTVEKGMLYLTGPEIVHTQITDKTDQMAELCLQCQLTLTDNGDQVDIQEARQLLRILDKPVYNAVHDEYGAIPLFMLCAEEASRQLVGHFSTIKNSLANLIIASARALSGSHVKAEYAVPQKENGFEIIQESILFLEDNYQHPISLEHVAEFVHFSPRHLGRMFKMVTGKTINQYLTDIRMFRAIHLLRETDYSLDRIAIEIGFANGSYLSQLFKRNYGYSPSEIRSGTHITV